MATTTVSSANQVQQWDDKYFKEYVRASVFSNYMGTDENSSFQIKENLTKSAGDRITFSLIKKLVGSGITGTGTMMGYEESLNNYGHQVTVDMLRNAVTIHRMEEQKTAINMRDAARAQLKSWSVEKMRDGIIGALMSPCVDGKTLHSAATTAQKNAWMVANADRVLFGAATANAVSGVYATALATIDNSADKMTSSLLSKAKRMAKSATAGAIRPIQVDNYGEWFVCFMGSYPFRDLKLDTNIVNAHQYASMRGEKNPLFVDGSIMWDGVICIEVPEIPILDNVGAGSPGIDVQPAFFCGAQALGLAWAQRPQSATEEFDYGAVNGVEIHEIRGIEKLMYNSVQHGVVSIYTAAVADT